MSTMIDLIMIYVVVAVALTAGMAKWSRLSATDIGITAVAWPVLLGFTAFVAVILAPPLAIVSGFIWLAKFAGGTA